MTTVNIYVLFKGNVKKGGQGEKGNGRKLGIQKNPPTGVTLSCFAFIG